MRYGLYARKSTEEDERQAQSITDQRERGLEFARQKNLFDVVLFEEACSAKEEGRREFNRMLTMVDRGELDGIIAWHPDRLSRNEMDAAALTMRIRKGILKEFQFVNYYFHNSPEGIMMLQIALSQSQYFSSKLSADVKRGMKSKIKKGWFPHRVPPGYRNDKHMDKGEKTISPDPDRFPLIRRVFDCILSQRYTPKQVLQLLNDEWGYRSPQTRRGGDAPLSKSRLYHLLSNPFYAGFFISHGQLYEGKHTAMLTTEEYRRIQDILGHSVRIQPKKHEFPYTGLIRCVHCGGLITAQITTNRQEKAYTYYRCQACPGQVVSERKLQAQIDVEIDRLDLAEEHFQHWAEEAVERFSKEERQTDQTVYTQKLSTLASLEGQLDSLLTALTKGLITDEEYAARRARLQEQRLWLRKEIDSAQLQADQARQAMENVIFFLTNVKVWMAVGEVSMKRACFRATGTNFVLDGKKVLWEPHPLLMRVRDGYKGLEAQYREIKHDETLSDSTKNERIAPIVSAWSGIWNMNQTLAMEECLTFPNLAITLNSSTPL